MVVTRSMAAKLLQQQNTPVKKDKRTVHLQRKNDDENVAVETTTNSISIRQYTDVPSIRKDMNLIEPLPLGEVRTILTRKLCYNLIVLSPTHPCFQNPRFLRTIINKMFEFAEIRYDLFGEFFLPLLNILRNNVKTMLEKNTSGKPLFPVENDFIKGVAVQLFCELDPTDIRAIQIQEHLCTKGNARIYQEFAKIMLHWMSVMAIHEIMTSQTPDV